MSTASLRDDEIAARITQTLSLAAARDRQNIENHLAACDAEPDPAHARLFRHLIALLSELAPLPVRTSGGNVIQFFVPDGKYRMQVFVLEDTRDGGMAVYLPDVLAEAVGAKVLAQNGRTYHLPSTPTKTLSIGLLDSTTPPDQPVYVKPMTGWKRKAMRIAFDGPTPSPASLNALGRLCTLAARKWAAA